MCLNYLDNGLYLYDDWVMFDLFLKICLCLLTMSVLMNIKHTHGSVQNFVIEVFGAFRKNLIINYA